MEDSQLKEYTIWSLHEVKAFRIGNLENMNIYIIFGCVINFLPDGSLFSFIRDAAARVWISWSKNLELRMLDICGYQWVGDMQFRLEVGYFNYGRRKKGRLLYVFD